MTKSSKTLKQRIGAHVSAANGVSNAPLNAQAEGCETFQFFTSSPQTFKVKEVTDEEVEKFKENCAAVGIDPAHTYVHASYLINLASPKNTTRHGSISLIRKGLETCSRLGVRAMMFHTGSSTGYEDKAEALSVASKSIEKILDGYTGSTMLLVENAAGSGNTLGANFTEVGQILDGVAKKYQKHLGVCIDTQHAFASGYDWTDKKATAAALKEFDTVIGLDRLIVVQVNDSKVECGANKDRHEHIADGHIGAAGMKNIFAHPAMKEMDFCLETPFEGREADIITLKKIRG